MDKTFFILLLRTHVKVFEFIWNELEKIMSCDEINMKLSFFNKSNKNLLQLAARKNKSLKLYEFLWKTFRKYFAPSEILVLIKHVGNEEENLLFYAVRWSKRTKEIVELTWNEIKSFMKF